MDVTLNNTACLIQKTNLTETVVTNVCTGEVTDVPHGTADYIGPAIIGILLVALAVLISIIAKQGLVDIYSTPHL